MKKQNVELIKNARGYYEIFADGKYITGFPKKKEETSTAYKERAEREFDAYCDKLSNITKNTSGGKSIKSREI